MNIKPSLIFFPFLLMAVPYIMPQTTDKSIDIKIVSDESDAVLFLLDKKKENQPITEEDWKQLSGSEGYMRLKNRESSMHRDFTDDEFKSFVLSDTLFKRCQMLKTGLERFKKIDIVSAALKALRYLPEDAKIKAKIYPVIKPKTNSFVFELKTDPAIFIYLDPETSLDKLENILSHEFHHIGYANSCAESSNDTVDSKNTLKVIDWIHAFGEGFAMLAAAGGPDIHPHQFSSVSDKNRWDRDMKNFNNDLNKLDKFFSDILEGKLTEEETDSIAFTFFGIQGPWYTVGWKMAVTIENQFGRAKLIQCICNQKMLLLTYNEAAEEFNKTYMEQLAEWSPSLIKEILISD